MFDTTALVFPPVNGLLFNHHAKLPPVGFTLAVSVVCCPGIIEEYGAALIEIVGKGFIYNVAALEFTTVHSPVSTTLNVLVFIVTVGLLMV